MWKKDAITKNWTVPVEKMNKKKVYELSNCPPDWDKIDPYSDLEEMETIIKSTSIVTVSKHWNLPSREWTVLTM